MYWRLLSIGKCHSERFLSVHWALQELLPASVAKCHADSAAMWLAAMPRLLKNNNAKQHAPFPFTSIFTFKPSFIYV